MANFVGRLLHLLQSQFRTLVFVVGDLIQAGIHLLSGELAYVVPSMDQFASVSVLVRAVVLLSLLLFLVVIVWTHFFHPIFKSSDISIIEKI